MIRVSLIVAHDCNQLIGKGPIIPWHDPIERNLLGNTVKKDLAFFKTTTLNKPIVMGARTYASIGKFLPNRFNIVLSRTLMKSEAELEQGVIVSSFESALQAASDLSDEVFVIGGGQVYQTALPYANTIYRTLIVKSYSVEPKDNPVYFPLIEQEKWETTLIEKFDYGICEKVTRII